MAAVEKRSSPEDADNLQGWVCRIVTCLKVPRSNLTRDQRTVLKEFRGLEDEVILQTIKGNATMMMRSCDYDRKMKEMLGTSTSHEMSADT